MPDDLKLYREDQIKRNVQISESEKLGTLKELAGYGVYDTSGQAESEEKKKVATVSKPTMDGERVKMIQVTPAELSDAKKTLAATLSEEQSKMAQQLLFDATVLKQDIEKKREKSKDEDVSKELDDMVAEIEEGKVDTGSCEYVKSDSDVGTGITTEWSKYSEPISTPSDETWQLYKPKVDASQREVLSAAAFMAHRLNGNGWEDLAGKIVDLIKQEKGDFIVLTYPEGRTSDFDTILSALYLVGYPSYVSGNRVRVTVRA